MTTSPARPVPGPNRPSGLSRRLTAAATALLAALGMLVALSVRSPAASADSGIATTKLAVQLSGVFADDPTSGARSATTSIVVGTVTTANLSFVGGTPPAGSEAFTDTVVCASPDGQSCPNGTTLLWDFGDGATASTTIGQNYTDSSGQSHNPLTYSHAYTSPGAFTVRVTASTSTGYGSGSIKSLVSPRYADVDAAYRNADGSVGKAVNPVSTAVWAVSALGLMPSCKPYYTATSAVQVAGQRAEDPGRALFCPTAGEDIVSGGAGSLTSSTSNPIPRSDTFSSTSAAYTNTADCLAAAVNCGLSVSAFLSSDTSNGSPLTRCSGPCLTLLTNQKILTSAASPQLWYNPTDCADNKVAVYSSTGTLSVSRGVEPGCESRGDFLRALLKAVDGADASALAGSTGATALDTTSCPSGPQPDANGRDGLRRAAVLINTAGAGISPCNPDASLTKGEAYRMLAALIPAPSTSTTRTLADLADQNLGHGPNAEPYCGPATATSTCPWTDAIQKVLAAGAPLIGSAVCPAQPASGIGAACFNPDEAVTRAGAAQLLAFFVLGESSDVAAVQVALSADSTQVKLGDVVNLNLTVQAPSWLLPYQASYHFGVGAGIDPHSVTFSCPTTGSQTLPAGTNTIHITCQVTINLQPASGILPVVATVNGNPYTVNLAVTNSPPTIVSVSMPTQAESSGPANATINFSDPESNPLSKLQVAASASGPWSDLVETSAVIARISALNNASFSGTMEITPKQYFNGPYTVYVRGCDIGNACSPGYAAAGTIGAVNNPPVAYPITNIARADNVVSTSADCSAAQSGTLPANTFQLQGSDALDDGYSGYHATIATYQLSAPATELGALYVCVGTTWTRVPAGVTVSTPNAVVLFNPVTGRYGMSGQGSYGNYSYTVTDAGYPPPGMTSTPALISASNVQPNVPPTAVLTVSQATGASFTTDFTFNASQSNESGNTSAIAGYAFDYGDGTKTTAQSTPTAVHRYTAAGTYTVTLTVTDASGLTGSTTTTVTVLTNLVGNPTFETGVAQWNPDPSNPSVQIASTSTSPHGGTKAAAVTMGSGTSCLVTHTAPDLVKSTVAGTTYSTVAWVQPTTDSTNQSLTLTTTETNSGTQAGKQSTTVTLGAAGVWQQIPLDYIAQQSGSSLTTSIGLGTFSGTKCFSLDDVSITATVSVPGTVALSGSASGKVVTLNWPTSGPGRTYTMTRNGTSVGTISPTCSAQCTFSETEAANGTTYSFTVTAVNSKGQPGPVSNTVTVTTSPNAPTTAPTATAATSAVAAVTLTYTATGDGTAATSYTLCRSAGGGSCTVVDTNITPGAGGDSAGWCSSAGGAGVISCVDSGPFATSSTYTYQLAAVNAAGTSASGPVSAAVVPVPPVCAAGSLTTTVVSSSSLHGTDFWGITYKNTGATACSLSGYPGAVVFATASSGGTTSPAATSTGVSATVVLAPNDAGAQTQVSVAATGTTSYGYLRGTNPVGTAFSLSLSPRSELAATPITVGPLYHL